MPNVPFFPPFLIFQKAVKPDFKRALSKNYSKNTDFVKLVKNPVVKIYRDKL